MLMKYLGALCLPLVLLGCVTPPVALPNIQSVEFVSTTGTVAPDYWRGQTLTVNSNLHTKQVTTGRYGDTVLETRTGMITQAQFDALSTALRNANFTRVQSTLLSPPPVGGGNETLTVQTDQGAFVFKGPSTAVFPPAIGAVFGMRGQYVP
jgi:hypothetical protein